MVLMIRSWRVMARRTDNARIDVTLCINEESGAISLKRDHQIFKRATARQTCQNGVFCTHTSKLRPICREYEY